MNAGYAVQEYSPLAYANLPELDIAKERLVMLTPVIDVLGQAIVKHEMQNAVGVSLLHKHFNLMSDERLVRSLKDNVMTITPAARQLTTICPFVWAFSKIKLNEPYGCFPVEFIALTENVAHYVEAAKKVESNEAFLRDFFRTLSHYGVASTFGLGLIVGTAFTFKPNERLMETEIPGGSRTLTLKAVHESEFEGKEATQTLWTY